MCSHGEIIWKTVPNTVVHRMIDDSFTHKFVPSRKIRKRTKLMNAEIKKRGIIKSYDQYIALKDSVIQMVPSDYDTDDTGNLSDIDYSIIYNSESKLNQYRRVESFTSRIFTSDEDTPVKKRSKKSVNTRQQKASTSQVCSFDNKDKKSQTWTIKRSSKAVKKNTKKSVNTGQKENFISRSLSTSDENDDEKEVIWRTKKNNKTKPVKKNTNKSVNPEQQQDFISQSLFTSDENDDEKKDQMKIKTRNKTKAVAKKTKKSVNIGWQEVVKKDKSMTFVSDSRQCLITDTFNIKENISQNNKCDLKAGNKRCLSPRLESQDDTVPYKKRHVHKDITQKHNSIVISELDFPSNPESDSPPNPELVFPSNPESDPQNNVFHDTTQILEDSRVITDEINSELNGQINSVVCTTNPEAKVMIKNDQIQRESDVISDKSSYSWSLQISPNNKIHKSKLATPKIQSSLINDQSSSISRRRPSVSSDHSCEKPIKVDEKSPMNTENDNAFLRPTSCGLNLNPKRNLTSMFDTVPCTQVSSPDTSHDQEKDSGIDEDSQDKFVKKVNTKDQNDGENTVEKVSVPSEPAETDEVAEEMQKDSIKDVSLKVDGEILKEQDTADNAEAKEPKINFSELKQTEEEDVMINNEAKTPEKCNVQKKQPQPTVMSNEIVNKRYKIVCKKDNEEIKIMHEDADLSKLDTSTSCPNTISDIDDTSAKMTNEILIVQEMEYEENEEDDASMERCASSQTKKRLRQLNLTTDSDSRDSENENGYRSNADRDSKSHTNNSFRQVLQEDKVNRENKAEENDNATLHSDDTYEDADAKIKDDNKNSVSEESDEETSHNEDVGEQRETHSKDNSGNEERPGNNERNRASEERHNGPASINGWDMNDEDDQRRNNVYYRPRNLQELVEDQGLVMTTLPASLTLADISDDEEAFIVDVPEKLLQYSLKDQLLILKEKTIRFGKHKFRIVNNKVSTVSCIFATGKKRKPYKIVNLKEISTITVGERLSHPTEDSDKPNSYDVDISSKKE